jgi:hypothetical protein
MMDPQGRILPRSPTALALPTSIAGNYVVYGATGASFLNSGALIKSGGTGAATIDVNFTGAAGSSIAINQGTLRFSGPTITFAAPVSGAGTLELNSGADKISTSSFTMGGFLVDGATVPSSMPAPSRNPTAAAFR